MKCNFILKKDESFTKLPIEMFMCQWPSAYNRTKDMFLKILSKHTESLRLSGSPIT